MRCLVFSLILTCSILRAGTIVSLKDQSTTSGKLTLNPTAIHLETGATPIDLPLDSILEADFSEGPFSLDYFSSLLSPNQLPPDWKGQDIGKHSKDGSFTYANGILTLTGSGYDPQRAEKEDQFYILGHAWTGNGQISGRLKDLTPNPGGTAGGPMVRDTTDPLSTMQFMSMRSGDASGLFVNRGNQGEHVGWSGFPSAFPTWFRMSWNGSSLESEVSSDGRKWDTIGQSGVKNTTRLWIGLAVNSGRETELGSAVFDQILLTPPAAEPGTLPPGVLFIGGTFLSGGVDFLNPNGGKMSHAGKPFDLAPKQVAAVISHPLTTPQRNSNASSLPGLLFKNGDFLQADLNDIQGSGFFQVTSIALGPLTYYGDSVRAFLNEPLKPVPSHYEIRLRDGSILQVQSFAADGAQFIITDVSGLTIHIDPAEIAQFRAGSIRVQNLIDVAWKTAAVAGAPPVPTKPTPAAPATPAAQPSANPLALPDANSFTAPPVPPSETWQGPNQEQIIIVTAGNQIEMPLSGKFVSLSTRVALSPDSPPGAQASLHILVDGKEAPRVPLKNGEVPQRINLTLQHPKKIAFSVESATPGTRLLLIDPVAVRESATR